MDKFGLFGMRPLICVQPCILDRFWLKQTVKLLIMFKTRVLQRYIYCIVGLILISSSCTQSTIPPTKSIQLSVTPNIALLAPNQTIIISVESEEWKQAHLQWFISSNQLKTLGNLSSSTDSTVVYQAPTQGEGEVVVAVKGVLNDIATTASVSFSISNLAHKCNTVIYFDDFSDQSRGWAPYFINESYKSNNGYKEEQYYFDVRVADAPMWQILEEHKFDFGNNVIYIDGTIKKGKGSIGILLDFQGNAEDLQNSNYYLVGLTSDGLPQIERHRGRQTVDLVSATSVLSATSTIDQIYHMAIEHNQSEIILFVNGQELARSQVDNFGGVGALGLFMQATKNYIPMEVSFDNLRICK